VWSRRCGARLIWRVRHGAAYKQLPLVAKYLIDKRAKIEVWNQKNKIGWTPLRMAEGVVIETNLRSSAPMAAVLREAMTAAGVSTVVEPDILRAGHPVTVEK
jgi:hypothetical protein